MAAKPKLTPEQWSDVRKHWEGDPREGYAWLVDALSLPVSAPAVRKVAIRDAWAKPTPGAAKVKKPSEQARPVAVSMVSKVSLGNHAKVSETIEAETFSDDAVDGDIEDEVRSLGGRPTLYKPEYAERAYKLCLLGATDKEIADYFEVSVPTITQWKRSKPGFLSSIREGKIHADTEVAFSAFKSATGQHFLEEDRVVGEEVVTLRKQLPPDATAQRMWLFNRRPKEWKAAVEQKQDVNINVFPPKETLDGIFERVLSEAKQRDAVIEGRWERLGLVNDGWSIDGD